MTAQQPPFRIETRVVQIPVTVTNASGRPAEGLTAGDFRVLDDAIPRAIALDVFGSGAAPISLVIAIQTSGLSAGAVAKIRRIGSLIQPLVIGHRGEAAVVTFDSAIQWSLEFTSDPARIERSIKAASPASNDQARLYDAVIAASRRLKDRPDRKILMLISESRDRGSRARLEAALEAVEREGVEVFAAPYSAYATSFAAKPEELPPPSGPNFIAVFGELARLGKTNDLEALTQATGGALYPFARERTAEKAIESLGVEVHSQYILSFTPGAAPKGMHRIEVSVPNRPDLRVRARNAYWSD